MIDKEILERHISVHPEVQHSRPCVKGTRTPVYVILEALAMGMDIEEIEREFSPVSKEDVRACILFAALLADEEELISQVS